MAIDPEVLGPEVDTDTGEERLPVRLRHPSVPISINELAALKGEAIEVLEARIQILETARKRGIRMTAPEDWVLFKSPDGRVTGYLQDAGCDRIRDITGIEVFNVSEPQRVSAADGKSFMYLIRGSGRSRLTLQVVEDIEGGRGSLDDFCKDKTGTALELAVRKAARANLDGNVVRELAGLKTVPLEDLQDAWKGTGKSSEYCRKGRGFGTKEERAGGEHPEAPKLVPPKCGVCGAPAVFRTSARGGFYGCSKWKEHEDKRWSVDLKEWEKNPASKPAAPEAAKTQATPPPDDEPPPMTDEDIPFAGARARR